MKRIVLLVSILGAAACGGSQKSQATGNGGGTGAGPASASSKPDEVVTIKGVEAGDQSCYLQVTDSKGTEQNYPADFELCPGGKNDASKLVGFPVTLSWGKANVLAASCEGDMNCGKSEQEDIVTTVTPVKK